LDNLGNILAQVTVDYFMTHQTGATTMIERIFLDHPAKVDETFFEHMRFALGFSGLLFLAGGAALVHAIVPALCETTASSIIKKLYERSANRS
jgi:hypothetical protein